MELEPRILPRTSSLIVRLALPSEMDRWRALMREHHYLGFERIVGKALHYVAVFGEQWVALIGWGSPALKCSARDRFIGWEKPLQFKRLHLIANNVRFLILPGWNIPNLASRLLALNVKRLSRDWLCFHGHPVLLAETFVDADRFRGTCYRGAGWQTLGATRGYSKSNNGYWHNGRPKLVLIRPLVPQAASRLAAPFVPAANTKSEEGIWMIDVNRLPLQSEGGLIDTLSTIVDPRKPRGVRHPVVTIVAIAICAVLSGARSFQAIAEWAQTLGRDTLRQLGSKHRLPPSEPTIRRTLQKLDAAEVDTKVGQWLAELCQEDGRAIAIDGKTLRGAHDFGEKAPHLLSAVLHQEAVVLGQIAVDGKENEITALPALLDEIPLQGAVVTLDAMHTQRKTACMLVEEKKADYVFIVKNNQPTLHKDIVDMKLNDSPPLMTTIEKAHGRIEKREIWTTSELNDFLDFPYVGQAFCIKRERKLQPSGQTTTETVCGITSLHQEKAGPERLMALVRKHWTIENRVHWVRDVTYDEDRCQIRKGGAQVMASLRNVAISLLRIAGAQFIAPALRHCARMGKQVLRMIGIVP